jgi:hypothetical protein
MSLKLLGIKRTKSVADVYRPEMNESAKVLKTFKTNGAPLRSCDRIHKMNDIIAPVLEFEVEAVERLKDMSWKNCGGVVSIVLRNINPTIRCMRRKRLFKRGIQVAGVYRTIISVALREGLLSKPIIIFC